MIILRQKAFSEKSEKDKKKSKIAGLAGVGLGAGGVTAGGASLDARLKANKIAQAYESDTLTGKRAKRIASKTGTTPFLNNVIGDPEKVEKAVEMEKRHGRMVKRAFDKQAKKSKRLGTVGLALGAASLGSGAYGLKKRIDANKEESKEDK